MPYHFIPQIRFQIKLSAYSPEFDLNIDLAEIVVCPPPDDNFEDTDGLLDTAATFSDYIFNIEFVLLKPLEALQGQRHPNSCSKGTWRASTINIVANVVELENG